MRRLSILKDNISMLKIWVMKIRCIQNLFSKSFLLMMKLRRYWTKLELKFSSLNNNKSNLNNKSMSLNNNLMSQMSNSLTSMSSTTWNHSKWTPPWSAMTPNPPKIINTNNNNKSPINNTSTSSRLKSTEPHARNTTTISQKFLKLSFTRLWQSHKSLKIQISTTSIKLPKTEWMSPWWAINLKSVINFILTNPLTMTKIKSQILRKIKSFSIIWSPFQELLKSTRIKRARLTSMTECPNVAMSRWTKKSSKKRSKTSLSLRTRRKASLRHIITSTVRNTSSATVLLDKAETKRDWKCCELQEEPKSLMGQLRAMRWKSTISVGISSTSMHWTQAGTTKSNETL